MEAIDIELDAVQSGGTAYYRLSDGLYEFLMKCEEQGGIVGFEWDKDRNFGVILKKKSIGGS